MRMTLYLCQVRSPRLLPPPVLPGGPAGEVREAGELWLVESGSRDHDAHPRSSSTPPLSTSATPTAPATCTATSKSFKSSDQRVFEFGFLQRTFNVFTPSLSNVKHWMSVLELTFIHRVSVKDANLTNIFLDILALLYWLANVSQGSSASRVNSVYI